MLCFFNISFSYDLVCLFIFLLLLKTRHIISVNGNWGQQAVHVRIYVNLTTTGTLFNCCSCRFQKLQIMQVSLFLFLLLTLSFPTSSSRKTVSCSSFIYKPLLLDWSLICVVFRYWGKEAFSNIMSISLFLVAFISDLRLR